MHVQLSSQLDIIRNIYREKFLPDAMNPLAGFGFKMELPVQNRAHSLRLKFETVENAVSDIWASNVIHWPESEKKAVITIFVDPAVQRKGKQFQKAVVSHEFLEVLKALLDGKRSKSVRTRQDLVLFYHKLAQQDLPKPCINQDTQDEFAEIELATRNLLVSHESLNIIMSELGFDWARIRKAISESPVQAQQMIDTIVDAFSLSRHVDREVVRSRFYESLDRG
ncbi:hypothetical protein [Gimesia panareensis]|uniref:hypothetical protein n=1 Tax=Gimesia panareensis TaxID=2527978 RepID=UPI001189105F|nr:hypothetical protein [Gimesia panareensis]QDU52946.1 hypothetical protein Pan110_53280 [Gimesia panareensis]